MVDLRNCKPGDKLVSKHGLVLEYVRPLPEGDYMDHEVRYPDEAPYKGSKGTRTHEGYVMRRKRLEEDHDIVRIVSSEVMKAETLEEAGEKLYPNKESFLYRFQNIERKAFTEGAKWQQEQDNKELAMWKLAVEKQEARCTSLRGVISDLQDKNKYSEEDMREAFYSRNDNWITDYEEWFKQFKKK